MQSVVPANIIEKAFAQTLNRIGAHNEDSSAAVEDLVNITQLVEARDEFAELKRKLSTAICSTANHVTSIHRQICLFECAARLESDAHKLQTVSVRLEACRTKLLLISHWDGVVMLRTQCFSHRTTATKKIAFNRNCNASHSGKRVVSLTTRYT